MSKTKIDALLASFNESLSLLRKQCQRSGLGRRFQLLNPTATLNSHTASTLSALKDALSAHASQLSESNYVHALLLLGAHTQLPDARSLFSAAKAKFPLSADVHSAMMYAAARAGALEETCVLFRARQRDGLPLTRQMYEAVLEAHLSAIESSQLRGGEGERQPFDFGVLRRWYWRMLGAGHRVSIAVLTTLLKAAGRLKDAGAVEEVRREQERLGIEVDAQFQEAVLFALLQCGQLEAAHHYYSTVQASERFFNVMLHGLIRLDALHSAKNFLSQERAVHGFRPAPGVACLLVEGAARMGALGEGRRWMEELVVAQAEAVDESVRERAVNAMLRAYLRAGDLRSFYEIYDRTESDSAEGELDKSALDKGNDALDKGNEKGDDVTTTGTGTATATTKSTTQPGSTTRLALLLKALECNPHPHRLHSAISRLKSSSSSASTSNNLPALFHLLRLCRTGEQMTRSLLSELELKERMPALYVGTIAYFGAYEECKEMIASILSDKDKSEHSDKRDKQDKSEQSEKRDKQDKSTPSNSSLAEALLLAASLSSNPLSAVTEALQWLQHHSTWISPTAHLYAMKGFYAARALQPLSQQWLHLKSSRLPAKIFSAALAVRVRALVVLEGDREGAVRELEAHRLGWDSECLQLYLSLHRDRLPASALLAQLRESEIGSRLRKLGKPLIDACNEVLMGALLFTEEEGVIEELVRWMAEQSIFADAVTVRLLLKAGRLAEAESLVLAYKAAGRVPPLACLPPILRSLLFDHCSQLNDAFNVRAESLSQWAVEEVAGLGGGGDEADGGLKEILEIWREFFGKHRVMGRVQEIEAIMRSL